MPARGQRAKFTAESQDRLVALLRAGNYVAQACAAAGVSRRTFYDWWQRGDPLGTESHRAPLRRFRARCEQAQAEAEARQVAVVAAAARENWQAAAWWLERRHPERWARVTQRDKEADVDHATMTGDAFAEVDELAQRRRQH